MGDSLHAEVEENMEWVVVVGVLLHDLLEALQDELENAH